ncbi:unnamed protein product [Meganyctiphanes norvegica]|uniref:Uncharacterized protein n=1 Tax=Meganyctiphanes norvegica TaxID=48144 RepID=A0AAV2PWK2_MEGNR
MHNQHNFNFIFCRPWAHCVLYFSNVPRWLVPHMHVCHRSDPLSKLLISWLFWLFFVVVFVLYLTKIRDHIFLTVLSHFLLRNLEYSLKNVPSHPICSVQAEICQLFVA